MVTCPYCTGLCFTITTSNLTKYYKKKTSLKCSIESSYFRIRFRNCLQRSSLLLYWFIVCRMPALQRIEVSIGNPRLMLSRWKGETDHFDSIARAIVFVPGASRKSMLFVPSPTIFICKSYKFFCSAFDSGIFVPTLSASSYRS